MYFDRKKFAALQNATPQELGVPVSPCASCPRGPAEKCTKGFKPGAPNTCVEWAEWNYDIWPIVTERIRKKIKGGK